VLKASATWRRRIQWTAGILAASALAVAIAWLLFIPVADWVATHDVGNVTGALRVSSLQTARDAARGRLLTLGAGIFAAGALAFTARNFTLARRTFELSEQGQVTDRYTKAIEQLGSDKVDVRIGGIYALERIALDSRRDYPTVMKVLAAFIREHSREQLRLPEPDTEPLERLIRPDIQAAVTVITNGGYEHDRDRIDLAGVNLAGADLVAADLRHVNLSGADLSGAKLTAAKLADIKLAKAELSNADLTDTDLAGADLTDADLTYAQLARADVSRADLSHAILSHADLTGTILLDAELPGAILSRAILTDANMASAKLPGAELFGANLVRTKLRDADLTSVDLVRAILTSVDFVGADLTGAYFSSEAFIPEGWKLDPRSSQLRRVYS
jgi:uncharacterized protein YjbI with pentapeptide repeats